MSVFLSDTNPNETCGGGGCVVCGPTKNTDQRGPFAVVVNANEMESNVSPHVVVCATCLDELNAVFESEALSAGEPSPPYEHAINEDAPTGATVEWKRSDEEVPSL